ncbi:MAG: hypothetical protein ACT4TC_09075 [Myxococcaceae bacterium]
MSVVALISSLILTTSVAAPPRVAAPSPGGPASAPPGGVSSPLAGEPIAAARAYVEARRVELKLPVTSALGAATTFSTRFGGTVHFPQWVDGLPVHNGKIIVSLDAKKRVYLLTSSVVSYDRAVLQWKITAERAQELAAQRTPLALPNTARSKQMLFQVGNEVHAGFLAHVPSASPVHNWYVAVDATTGEILWSENRIFRAENDAKVYLRTPGGLDAGVGKAPTTDVTLEHLLPAEERDGGFLEGDQLSAYNCCPTADCVPDAGSRRATGTFMVSGFNVPYNVAICQRVRRASNDAGSFVYTPRDPATPKSTTNGVAIVDIQDPANSDPFVEVQAFYQVNKIYDFARALSYAAVDAGLPVDAGFAPFRMRDTMLGRKPAVWTNVTLPNVDEAIASISVTNLNARADTLVHENNAVFVAKESFGQMPVPEYHLDVDTVVLFQGARADFGYDSTVIWHEMGHGVIHATAAFDSFTLDSRSGNNEGGALHEGLADYLSAAYGGDPRVGDYVGPRTGSGEGTLRSMINDTSCPTVLWGEVHQDSQHFSAALWIARQHAEFQGTDNGRTFDAVVYAALVSMTPATDYAQAAEIIAITAAIAFPNVSNAAQKVRDFFAGRGVTGCSKVVDVTGSSAARPFVGIGGTGKAALAANQVVPGPYQMHLTLPRGARTLTVKAYSQPPELPGSAVAAVRVLTRVGSPITFTRNGGNLTNDAQASSNVTSLTGNITLTTTLDVPCNGELFFSLANSASVAANLSNVTFTTVDSPSCTGIGADGGSSPGTDAGAPYVTDGVPGGPTGDVAPRGCGCQGPLGGASVLALLAAVTWAARRKRDSR